MTKGTDPSGRKVRLTPPGKGSRSAEVLLAVGRGITDWVVEEGVMKPAKVT